MKHQGARGSARNVALSHLRKQMCWQDRGILKVAILGWKGHFNEKERFFLNSSQGRAKRKVRLPVQLRRKRQYAGSSSILFFSKVTFLWCLCLNGPWAKAEAPINPELEKQYRAIGDSFEAMMLQNFYRQMKNSNRVVGLGDDSPFAPSNGEQIFEAMRDDLVIGKMADQHPLGISDLVVRQLKGYKRQ